eukprot:GHRR01026162.1.p1 GENE.GHRR01026162.1~~GHRR01026162.1.p1  ORF type:complete len:128 (+),score=26.20 GHRR01026162.1:379-762(+)
MQSQKAQVLSRYKELLRLIQRLPFDKAVAAKAEAQQTIRQRRAETSPDTNLLYLKELAARISFLRMTTPRRAGEPLDSGRYILRDGELVKSTGESKGARWALAIWRCCLCACMQTGRSQLQQCSYAL